MSKTSVKSPPVWKELTWYLGANRKYWSILHSGQPCALFETEQRSDIWNKRKKVVLVLNPFLRINQRSHTGTKILNSPKKTQFENLTFHKIRIFKISFFTKFKISKSYFLRNSHQILGNFWIKSWFLPQCVEYAHRVNLPGFKFTLKIKSTLLKLKVTDWKNAIILLYILTNYFIFALEIKVNTYLNTTVKTQNRSNNHRIHSSPESGLRCHTSHYPFRDNSQILFLIISGLKNVDLQTSSTKFNWKLESNLGWLLRIEKLRMFWNWHLTEKSQSYQIFKLFRILTKSSSEIDEKWIYEKF